ncbi:cation/H(+) antiporter 15-like [Neltuma alba]|uniref:cation/H(+) antiporter 15-like n=1 Tax=Neltuma alba TaxID=207710 RepID=UPI0010A2B98F|nr:cation/H(+) antiporter 15-like [Prosopis alba]
MESYSFTQADSSIIVESDGQLRICARNDKHVGSHGFWNGDNPLDFVLPVTLVQIVLAIVASQLVYFLLRPFRTPRFVCSVLGGMLLGPSFLGHSSKFGNTLYPPRQAVFLGTASTIAGAYFIFIAALQMDVTTTLRAAKRTWRFGIVPFLSSLTVVSSLVYANDRSLPNIRSPSLRTFFSAIMSFSNFIVISDSLKELNLASSELGQIALSSAMINATMQWLTFLLMSFVRTTDLKHSVEYLICYWLLIYFCIFGIRPIMLMIARNTPVGKPVKEVYIMRILAGVLFMAAAADVMGLSFLQGPLLFGLIMPNGPPLGTTLIEKTQNIMADFLMPLFFIYIGTNSNIYELQRWSEITTLFWIILVGYVVKVLASSCSTGNIYQAWRDEDEDDPRHCKKLSSALFHVYITRDMYTATWHFWKLATTQSPICTYMVHFVELLGKSTPFLLPLDRKRMRKTLSINYPNTNHIVRAFENYAQNSNGQVKARPYVNVAPYKQMHEAICNLAQVENVPFLIIPFHENNQTLGSHMISSIHDLNSNFQLYAPCTVGILVR